MHPAKRDHPEITTPEAPWYLVVLKADIKLCVDVITNDKIYSLLDGETEYVTSDHFVVHFYITQRKYLVHPNFYLNRRVK